MPTKVVTQDELKAELQTKLLRFAFMKQSDKSIRIALGTNDKARIPASAALKMFTTPNANKKASGNDDNIQYFDLEKNNWRVVHSDSPITILEEFSND